MGDSEVPLRTVLHVPGMDCPTEAAMIRVALAKDPGVQGVDIDLDARQVAVTHRSSDEAILAAISRLGLGSELVRAGSREEAHGAGSGAGADRSDERRVLLQVLLVNALMFAVEVVVGWIAESTGLLADSLDMLADASVYAMSLYAVGRGAIVQGRIARVSGLLQLGLASGMLFEVGRRALAGSDPSPMLMMVMATVALGANSLCVWLLRRHRDGGAHMRASWIFTTSDALANLGVIVAGLLVHATGSPVADLVVGAAIALVVLRSAVRIIRLR